MENATTSIADYEVGTGARKYAASIVNQLASQKITEVDQLTGEVVHAAEINQTSARVIYLEVYSVAKRRYPTLVAELATPAWRELVKIASQY